MTSRPYDPDHIRVYFDDFGEREWDRFELNPRNRVNFYIHRWFLQEYVHAGEHVLEVGAGPGRFTIELARLGAVVTVSDISPQQLELNRVKVQRAHYEDRVTDRLVADVVDLSAIADNSFDAVVCYGGPLSYVFDQRDQALEELLRVVKPGNLLLISVMSLLGSSRISAARLLADAQQYGLDMVQQIIDTGDQQGEISRWHNCHMYRWQEFQAFLESHGCTIVDAGAANLLSVGHEVELQPFVDDPKLWETFLRWELNFCREPGALDGGTHIIAVVRRE